MAANAKVMQDFNKNKVETDKTIKSESEKVQGLKDGLLDKETQSINKNYESINKKSSSIDTSTKNLVLSIEDIKPFKTKKKKQKHPIKRKKKKVLKFILPKKKKQKKGIKKRKKPLKIPLKFKITKEKGKNQKIPQELKIVWEKREEKGLYLKDIIDETIHMNKLINSKHWINRQTRRENKYGHPYIPEMKRAHIIVKKNIHYHSKIRKL